MHSRSAGSGDGTAGEANAALAALSDQSFVAASRDANIAARTRFVGQIEALGNHGLRALPSKANFVFVVFEGALAAETALQAIAAAGYAVRHLPGQGLPQALRITIGTSAQMDEIAAVLRGLCGAQA